MSGFFEAGVEYAIGIGAPLYNSSNLGPVELLPNPDFVFPARPHTASLEQVDWKWPARRPRSHQHLPESSKVLPPCPRASLSILPSFSFNPAGAGQTSPIETPPYSPDLTDPFTPSRSTRHRRGGSELIGGDVTTSNVKVMTCSPGEGSVDEIGQTFQLRPPTGRRHAHRRSGAISCHDLATILQPRDVNTRLRSGSAPTSPLASTANKPFFTPESGQSFDQGPASETFDDASDCENTPQRRPPSRARVGFADRVECIRPLSTISSETESSMSTIRGHSLSNSLSSVQSANTTSPSGIRMSCPSLDTTYEDENVFQCPNSAGTEHGDVIARTLDFQPVSPKTIDFEHDSNLDTRSVFTAGTSNKLLSGQTINRSRPEWWDFKLHPLATPQYAEMALNASSLPLSKSPLLSPESPHSPTGLYESDGDTVVDEHITAQPRQPRRVRSWAHSLISRKHKSNKDLTRPVTPSGSCLPGDYKSCQGNVEQPQMEDDIEINFDEDNTVTIITESAKPTTSHHDAVLAHPVCSLESDIRSPVIDLDTALAPLHSHVNSHLARQVRDRRLMHSSSATSMPHSAVGLHRRTESAPELMVFGPRSSKLTQPFVMPDVFEEEDEEFTEEAHGGRSKTSDAIVKPLVKTALEQNHDDDLLDAGKDQMRSAPDSLPLAPGFGWTRHKKSGLSIETGSRPSSTVFDPQESHSSIQPRSYIEEVEGDEAVRDKSLEDIITPPLTGDKSPMTTQVRFPYALSMATQQIMTPDTMSDASMYSPFFNRSQVSFDTTRFNTAPSSIAESRSFKFGEPGLEPCGLIDHIPSLTNGHSTMVSPVIYAARPPRSSGGTGSIYSVHSTATVDLTQRKRASIVSLTRLISTSLGERSLSSIKSRPTSQDPMTDSKKKRSQHRLSKLMFWKNKEARPVTRG